MLEVNNFDAIHQPGVARPDQGLVVGRGQAGDDQLPHAQAGEGRPLRRAHLRSHQGLGVLLRQVQAHPLQGDHLRQVRRGGHPFGAPRADGPHQAGAPSATSGTSRARRRGSASCSTSSAQPGAHPLLRPVRGDPRRRGARRRCAIEQEMAEGIASPPSRWSRKRLARERRRRQARRGEAAHEADVRRHDERFTHVRGLATAAQQVEASIKEGETVAEDVVRRPPARSSCAPARRRRRA